MRTGSLTVVGLGVKLLTHVSPEALTSIRQADKVLFVLDDPLFVEWIREQNSNAEFFPFSRADLARNGAPLRWIEDVLHGVRAAHRVCVVLSGHPAICVPGTHEVIRQARREGFPARMLPGISVADCLFADLGEDPSESGFRCFDATDFLIRRRDLDGTGSLLLLQIDRIGQLAPGNASTFSTGLRLLVESLQTCYGLSHEVVLYRAAEFPVQEPLIHWLPLRVVADRAIEAHTALYVPPRTTPPIDVVMLDRLGLPRDAFSLPDVQ